MDKKQKIIGVILTQLLLIIILVVALLYLINIDFNKEDITDKPPNSSLDNNSSNDESNVIVETDPLEKDKAIELERLAEETVVESDKLEMTYDYEGALAKLEEFEEAYGSYTKIEKAKTTIIEAISRLDNLGVYKEVEEVNHIFFHSLIVDIDKAFDGDGEANGYNYYMTTASEFKEMMRQMYEDDYVLVSIHDLVKPIVQEDNTIIMQEQELLLPPNKKPFVLSQDDVNYYEYMENDGFASRIVIDQNGRPSTEIILEDGTISVGDYDIVPILETFIEEHPDFSYKGARGILGITGYEGILGYRTNNLDSPTYEEEKLAVKEVVRVLKKHGWEFASHSWGHRDMNKYNYNSVVWDTNKWLEEVASLVGQTDIYIFPYGIDIEGTDPYAGEKYQFLREQGFLYFFGVYKSPWMQRTEDYVRMTRRPLDGQAMLQFPERLTDLFDLDKVIDTARPPLQ